MAKSSRKYLTGFTRYRKGWFGGLILQVWEVTEFDKGPSVFNWRDAQTKDIPQFDQATRVKIY